jgi:hypothetical protein
VTYSCDIARKFENLTGDRNGTIPLYDKQVRKANKFVGSRFLDLAEILLLYQRCRRVFLVRQILRIQTKQTESLLSHTI